MFQNWITMLDYVKGREKELLEEAKRARAAGARRRKDLGPPLRRPGVVLCESCPLRALQQ